MGKHAITSAVLAAGLLFGTVGIASATEPAAPATAEQSVTQSTNETTANATTTTADQSATTKDAASSRTWTLDPSTNADLAALGTVQNTKAEFQDLTIDATATGAKFAPRTNDVQINPGTVITVPVPVSADGTTITLSLSGGTASISASAGTVDGNVVTLPATEADGTVDITVTATTYVNGLTVAANQPEVVFPGTPTDVAAADKTWDFTENGKDRPSLQGNTGTYDGIAIDARAAGAKFAPRTAATGGSDTQVNSGTILYVPVAKAEGGATITVQGQAYGATLSLDGNAISTGTGTVVATDSVRYVPIAVAGTGSLYLTGIVIDYASDRPAATSHVVTVGPNEQYPTIQAALDANDSSETNRLVLKIAPGDYREKVTVTKPGVTFANADVTAKRAVTIRASYYSSNTFDANGVFVPQDDHDLGTDKCATVTIAAGATGFAAYGITFQNDYNVTDHTAAGEQTPAVALNTKADKVYLKNSRVIGRQDTLYVQGTGNRVYVDGGYVEGTVDFVFGDANAYFTGTQLHMAAFPGKNNGYFTAANTGKAGVGLVFDRCDLTVSPEYGGKAHASLGRPWQTVIATTTHRNADGSSYLESWDASTKDPKYADVSSAVTYLDSTMPDQVPATRWNVWTGKDKNGKSVDVTYHADVRFREIASHAADGTLLDPADYKNIVLGTMENPSADEVAAVRAQLIAKLGFGDGAGLWTVPDGSWPFAYDANYTKPGEPVPGTPTTPGAGQGTGQDSADANGANKADTLPSTGSAVLGVVIAVVVLAVAGIALVLFRRSRRR
ncbi:pectinesterase family protein [Bifidobacterium aerophilum]|uniref:pectinesterase family protein n=1 Tax=Bifidobacterium aerophilum TaxID=1798155 RepID=UPI001EF9398A|nr:pectinesterase family protein [Bifidobacterium aerophilum]